MVTVNCGALLEAMRWFIATMSLLILVGMVVGAWADRRWDEYGRRRK